MRLQVQQQQQQSLQEKSQILFVVLTAVFFARFVSAEHIDAEYFTSIYSSTYENKFETPDSLSLFTSIKIASTSAGSEFLFIAAQSSGVIVMKDQAVIFQQAQTESVDAIFVTPDGEYVFFMENSKLCMFEFLYVTGTSEWKLQKIYEASEDFSEIVEVVFDSTQSIAVAAAVKGTILLFDISKRKSKLITHLDTFLIDPNLRGIKISADLKWIILSDFTHGAMLFRWVDENNNGAATLIKTKLDMYLIAVCDTVSPSSAVLTSDYRYFIIIQYWDGLSILDLQSAQEPHSVSKPASFEIIQLTPIVMNYWPRKSQPNGHALALSADERFIAIGERSVALYIIDISDRTKPQLFQTILANYFSLAASFSKDADEQYLYYSNGYSLLRFKKSTPNLNIDVPNLYNVHRSVNNVVGESKWRWIGSPDPKGEYYISSDYDDGIYIKDLRKSHLLMDDFSHIPSEGSSVDQFILFGTNSEYLAVPIVRDTTFIDIYNISDRSAPTLLTSILSVSPSYSYSMDYCASRNLLVFDQDQSVVLASTANLPSSVSVITVWPFPTGLFSFLNGAVFSYNGNYLILLERGNALALIDISNINNPVYLNKLYTLGGEFITKGKYKYTQYLFLADGLSGIKIIDQTKFPLIVVVSSVEVRGYASHVTLLSSGNYALISSFDKGQISLIDLSTITSPAVISTLQYLEETSVSTSVLETFDYFYIINQQGVRSVPLFSEAYIHTDIQLVLNQQTGTPTLQSLDKSTILQVGQIINFNFLILHPVDGIQITDVYYLQYYDIIDIPYWMTYNSADQTLELTIVKDSLGLNYSSSSARVQSNTIVIKTNKPVLVTDFIFTAADNGVDTTADQAQLIFNYLRSIGYLDKKAYVTSLFEYESTLTFSIDSVPDDNERLFALVKIVLQNTVMFNPILFYTKASLTMHVNPNETLLISYLQYIETVSDYVYLYLTIDTSLGKFVPQTYPGVITSTTDTLDQIKLEGDPENINKVLTSQVQLFLFSQNNTIGTMSIRLTDSINYEINSKHNLTDVSFLSYHPNVYLNPSNRLQDQFVRKFSGGIIDIKTSIDIEFSQYTFVTSSSSTLTYTAYLLKDPNNLADTYAIPDGFWLTFQSKLLKFQGTAEYANFNKKYCFVVEVSDSFSTANDYFCLTASGIPLILVLNLIIQYIGPVLFVLGFMKYKHIFYNICLAQRNQYDVQYAKLDSPFQMRILFIGQNLQMATIIFNMFLQTITFEERKRKKSTASQPNQQLSDEEQQQTRAKSTTMSMQLPDKQQRFSLLMKDQGIPQSRKKMIIDTNSVASRVFSSKQSPVEQQYLDPQTRTLLFDKFLNDLLSKEIQFKFNGHLAKVSSMQADILSPSHLLNRCLRGLLARHLLGKDVVATKVYECMRNDARGTKKDDYERANSWYKKYVYINHNSNDSQTTKTLTKLVTFDEQTATAGLTVNAGGGDNHQLVENSIFPKISLKTAAIKAFIESLELPSISAGGAGDDTNQPQEGISSIVNRHLIEEVLLADAFGLITRSSSIIFPSIGESLHMNEHEISSVEAFVKSEEKTHFKRLRKLLNMHYVRITSHKNRKLPAWIDYKLKKDILVLEGTPTEEEKNKFLIRFFDQRGFIVKQFKIKILKDHLLKIKPTLNLLRMVKKKTIMNPLVELSTLPPSIQAESLNDSYEDRLSMPESPAGTVIPSTFNSNNLEGFLSPFAKSRPIILS